MRIFSACYTITSAAALLTLVTSESSRALVYLPDDRQLVSTKPGSVFGPVGVVYGMPEAGWATAFLIDDCHALTVQHAFGQNKSAIGRQAVFAAGVSGPPSRWRITGATVIAEGGLQRHKSHREVYTERLEDWAVLRLRRCLGRTFGHVQLTRQLPRLGERIMLAGYPADKPLSDGLVVDPTCALREERNGLFLHDCSTLPGNSGSPLFRIIPNAAGSILQVFAIDEAGHSFGIPGADLVSPVVKYHANYASIAAPIAAFDLPDS